MEEVTLSLSLLLPPEAALRIEGAAAELYALGSHTKQVAGMDE